MDIFKNEFRICIFVIAFFSSQTIWLARKIVKNSSICFWWKHVVGAGQIIEQCFCMTSVDWLGATVCLRKKVFFSWSVNNATVTWQKSFDDSGVRCYFPLLDFGTIVVVTNQSKYVPISHQSSLSPLPQIFPRYKTQLIRNMFCRAVGTPGAGGAPAPPIFGRSVNPISIRGADYARHFTMCPPGFSDLRIALFCIT